MAALTILYLFPHPIDLNDYQRDYTTWRICGIVYTRLADIVLPPYYC
jgi:hypothetical protein